MQLLYMLAACGHLCTASLALLQPGGFAFRSYGDQTVVKGKQLAQLRASDVC